MNDADPALDGHTRAQRPQPPRQAPLRRPPLGLPPSVGSAVNAALDAARESGAALGAGVGAALRQGLDGSRSVAGAAEAGVQGFVERGVDTAYTVIDAYLRRGQQAAQRQPPFDPPAGPGWAGHGQGGWPQAGNGTWGQAASSLAGPWMQLVRAWADGLSALAPLASRLGAGVNAMNAAAASPGSQAAPMAAGQVVAGPRAKVTIEFLSRRLAEVEVALEPGADLAALHADWSRDGQPVAAPGSCAFHSEPGHVRLRLGVAESAAPGRHQATVADGHGQVWGSVAVTIAPRADAAPAAPGQPAT